MTVLRTILGLGAILLLAVGPSRALAAGPGGWEHVGGGLNDQVRALNTDLPGQLIAGGRFTDAGGNPNADRIAVWNGTAWGSLGAADALPGAASFVNAIAVDGSNIYAGGSFGDGPGGAPDYLAKWDGVSWQQFCAPLSAQVLSLEVVGTILYVGGSFLDVNADPAADQLIKCDLTTGNFIGPTVDSDADLDGGIQALTSDSSGTLYAGGTFINMDGVAEADYVARYNGTSWSAMGSGGPGIGVIDAANVDALTSDGTNVYVGADDVDIAGIPAADHVARWDGVSWSAVGPQFFPPTAAINGLLLAGAKVYATGDFQDAGGTPTADDIAVFDGTNWGPVGSDGAGNGPWLGLGYALAFFGGAPVVGGGFTNAGGDPLADRIASFPPPSTTTVIDPPPPPPPPPAVAKLDKTPKKKVRTEREKAKVTFLFSSTTAVSFVCKLDETEFAPCASPQKVKAKVGKHTFQVAGINSAGVVGEPDAFKFKVVRD